jgi:Tfp pilus assembly protein PilO
MQLGLNKLPWHGQILLFAIIGGAGIFAYHYFFGSNLREQLKSKEAQLAREHQEIAKGRAAEKRIVEFRAELTELETRFETLKTVLPEQRDVADMLRRIQMLATQSSLVVKAFRPQAVASKQLHQEWPMTIELDGTYHSLARFFDQVSKVPRIINIGGISIKAKPEQDATDGTTITALCTATTFVLLDKPPAVKKSGRPGVPAGAKPPTAAP